MKPFLPKFVTKAFSEYSPEAFRDFVKGLRIKANTESKSVAGVGIVFKDAKITVRVKRDPKLVTREEVTLLAKDYAKEEQEIINVLIARKVSITYEPNDPRQQPELSRAQEAKRDAKPRKTTKRKAESPHQFFEPGHNPQLHEESSVRSSNEPEK